MATAEVLRTALWRVLPKSVSPKLRHLYLPNGRFACNVTGGESVAEQFGFKCVLCKMAAERLTTPIGIYLYEVLGTPLTDSADAERLAEHAVDFHSKLATQLAEITARTEALYKPSQAE